MENVRNLNGNLIIKKVAKHNDVDRKINKKVVNLSCWSLFEW